MCFWNNASPHDITSSTSSTPEGLGYDPVAEYMSFTSIFEAVEVAENNEGTVFRLNPDKPNL